MKLCAGQTVCLRFSRAIQLLLVLKLNEYLKTTIGVKTIAPKYYQTTSHNVGPPTNEGEESPCSQGGEVAITAEEVGHNA